MKYIAELFCLIRISSDGNFGVSMEKTCGAVSCMMAVPNGRRLCEPAGPAADFLSDGSLSRSISGTRHWAGSLRWTHWRRRARALVATMSGNYPNVRGGTTFLNKGDVWKFGETTSGSRYSDSYLNGARLQQINLFPGNQIEIKIQEKITIYGYFMERGSLPPGNKIFR